MTVSSGTAAGQLIAVLASPALTRIYSPEQIGVLATCVSILSVLGAISALRLEVAIPLPDDPIAALSVLASAMSVVVGFSVLVAVVAYAVDSSVFAAIRLSGLDHYRWTLPAGVLAIGLHQTLAQWAVRHRAYRLIAKTRVLKTTSSAIIQVGVGLVAASSAGLLAGYVLGVVAAAGVLAGSFLTSARLLMGQLSLGSLLCALSRFRRFPLLSAPASLLNSFSLVAPVLILAVQFGPEAAAMYAIAQRAAGTPLGLVSQGVGQVFYAEGARLAASDSRALVTLFLRVSKSLVALGILPVALIAIAGPWLWGAVFGSQWEQAGVLARLLSAMFLGQMVASPVSGVLHIVEWQGVAAALDAVRVLAVLGALLLPSFLGYSLESTVAAYSVAMTATYVAWWMTSLASVRHWHLRMTVHP